MDVFGAVVFYVSYLISSVQELYILPWPQVQHSRHLSLQDNIIITTVFPDYKRSKVFPIITKGVVNFIKPFFGYIH